MGAASRGEGKVGWGEQNLSLQLPEVPRVSLPPTGRGVRSRGKRPEALPIPRVQLPAHSYILAENMGLERRVVGN